MVDIDSPAGWVACHAEDTGGCPDGQEPIAPGFSQCANYAYVMPRPAAAEPQPSAPTTTAVPTRPAVVVDPSTYRLPDDGGGIGSVLGIVAPVLVIAVVMLALIALVVGVRRDGRQGIVTWLRMAATGIGRLGPLWRWAWTEVPRRKGRAKVRAVRCTILLAGVVAFTMLFLGWLPLLLQPLAAMAILALIGGALQALRRTPVPPAVADDWWGQHLGEALRSVGILKPGQFLGGGDGWLTTHRDERGIECQVELPVECGKSFADVAAKHAGIAAALRLPTGRLRLSPGDNAARVKFYVSDDDPAHRTSAPSTVATASRTRWAEPVRIGVDDRGQPVTLATDEANVLIAGQPGSGKTSLTKVVLAHYLLDPSATVYVLDGKGSRLDYSAAMPSCERMIFGTDDGAVEDTIDMLTTVLGIVQARNATSEMGARPAGTLLLLEELQDVRAAASKDDRAAIDNTLGRIVRMGRAVGVSTLVSTQRPTVSDLPSGVRNLVSQRIALMTRNAADAAIVLGETPSLALPSRRGEALLATPTGTVAVTLDHLDGDAWQAVCARATLLRPQRHEAPPAAVTEPLTTSEPEPVDPMLTEVLAILADTKGLTATELLDRLPDWLRPASAARLGVALKAFPDDVKAGHRKGVNGKSERVWRAVAVPSSSRQPGTGNDGGNVNIGHVDGQTGSDRRSVRLPSSPSTGALR